MVNYPKDPIVRPVNVTMRKEGAYLTWRLPKNFPGKNHYKHTLIIRSRKYDYEAKNEDVIEGNFPIDKKWTVEEHPFIDKDVEPGERYSYYLYVIDKDGNYWHPGPMTGKIIEDGLPVQDGGEGNYHGPPIY
ncbi:MAG: hypothetical protein GF308_00960 [Candidatus Heimdallarchaeota archaeon]|nr:hypothetical protein [Candidatus Heimdallarchaeota archaeon]